jgi:putative ABC transport system substrate-binding protein
VLIGQKVDGSDSPHHQQRWLDPAAADGRSKGKGLSSRMANYSQPVRHAGVQRRDVLAVFGAAAAAAPLSARAQRTAMAVIGYLGVGSADTYAPHLAAFLRGLRETGYVEGQNLAVEYRWADGRYDRLPALAAELAGRKVDVMVTAGSPLSALAAKRATATIPIVFVIGADPVAAGLVASFARPGGNLTGISIQVNALMPKRLDLLTELVPWIGVVGLLVNPNNAASAERMTREVEDAARAKGLPLRVLKAGNASEIDAGFATLDQLRGSVLLVSADQFFDSERDRLVALAAQHAVPAIYILRDYAVAGGLMSYGPSLTEAYYQVGSYAGRILEGEKPADLPVQQPTKFELVINLKTAKQLGLAVPLSLLALADEVIE